MTFKLLFGSVFLFLIFQIYGVNHMDLITTMTGEHNLAYMGSSMASLDFNGDGYDDLIVCSRTWGFNQTPNLHELGKIYFYWGGPNFDNVADLVLEGTYWFEYSAEVYNLGDVNGDGIEDLGISHPGTPIGVHEGNPKFSIYYGRQIPLITQPDYTLELDYYQYRYINADALGDVNNDGYDDIGLKISHGGTNLYRVLLGGSLQNVDLFEDGRHDYASFFHGLGDINNDGYDDFSIGYFSSVTQKVILFFGSPVINVQDSLMLYHSSIFQLTSSCRTGDVNGDGYDDFIGYEGEGTLKFWYGRDEIPYDYDLLLTPYLAGHNADEGIRCGDVNNDGYSDIFGTYPTFDWNDGLAGFWLGGHNFNDTLDYTFIPPEELVHCNFGDVSTTGDYNGDGYCDYAIAAPFTESTWFQFNGQVFIYAGNGDLHDTTVSNQDDTNGVSVPEIQIKMYPNPINNKTNMLSISVQDKKNPKHRKTKLEIFNLKGQNVMTKSLTTQEENKYDVSRCATGKYIIKVYLDDQVYARKLTIK